MAAPTKKLVRPRALMSQAELDEAVRRHERYLTGRIGGQRALLSYRDLTGLNLAGQRLNDADFTGAFLPGAQMAGANLTSANLFGCNLTRADLREAILVRADLRGAVLRGANLEGADLFNADLRDGRLGQRVRIGVIEEVAIADTASADLEGARMVNANLTQAKLSGSIAAHTDFTDAVMRHCKLVRADLHNANLTGADLSHADLSGANLNGASLRNAILTNAIMHYTETNGADLAGALTQVPAGRKLFELTEPIEALLERHERWCTSQGIEGTLLDLSGFDLRDVPQLAGRSLAALTAKGAIFFGLTLDGIGLQAAQLQGADFRSCRMNRADLRGINLTAARLTNADLRDCDLGPLALPGGRSVVSVLENAEARHVDLRGANLSRAVLRGADLSAANLTGADLNGADLDDTKLSGVIGLA